MTSRQYVDRTGRTISRAAWETLAARAGHGHVALDSTQVDGRTVHVHTYWTGAARLNKTRPAPPIAFHTTVHGLGHGPQTWGWPDITTATAGHAAVLRWLTGQTDKTTGSGASEQRS